MTANDLTRRTALEQRRLVATKEVSPVEVLDAHLATIERVNPALNAIVTLATDQAREAAREAEKAVLHGDELGLLQRLAAGHTHRPHGRVPPRQRVDLAEHLVGPDGIGQRARLVSANHAARRLDLGPERIAPRARRRASGGSPLVRSARRRSPPR